ncbi:tautomerase family protein [Nocardia sp. CA-084685]|uniref:tautomerase family protein n=1 Tax=Nocardia sp. CA-084685 TaxID=3239970 RepID=UPI003D99BC7A
MVFVRVHLIKGRLNAAQKDELGAKLIQAVADVEGLVNNERHRETSWVQFYEFEPENWYAPANLSGANPDSRIQLDVITPQKLLSFPEEARAVMNSTTEAVRSVLGPGVLPAHGPWVHVHIIPLDQWALDGRVPDWEGFRALLRADTSQEGWDPNTADGGAVGPSRPAAPKTRP